MGTLELDAPPAKLQELLAPDRERLALQIEQGLEEYDKKHDGLKLEVSEDQCREAHELRIWCRAVRELWDSHIRKYEVPRVTDMDGERIRRIWVVTGGEHAGGISVRSGQSLKTPFLPERLATNSWIEELHMHGERLQYALVCGTGPDTGWISIKVKEKIIAKKVIPSGTEPLTVDDQEIQQRATEAWRRRAHKKEREKRTQLVNTLKDKLDVASKQHVKNQDNLQTCGECKSRSKTSLNATGGDGVWYCNLCWSKWQEAAGDHKAATHSKAAAEAEKGRVLQVAKAWEEERTALELAHSKAQVAVQRLSFKCAAAGCNFCVHSESGGGTHCCSFCQEQDIQGAGHSISCEGIPWVQPVILLGLIAANISSKACLQRFRHVLRSVESQRTPDEAEFIFAVSWSSTEDLKKEVEIAINWTISNLPSTMVGIQQCQADRRLSKCQHLESALACAQEKVRQSCADGDLRKSVWVMFGDDSAIWHSTRVAEHACAIRSLANFHGVGVVATMAHAKSSKFNMKRSKIAFEEEVNVEISTGQAHLLDDEGLLRPWREDFQCKSCNSLVLPEDIRSNLVFEYVDFCPRLRILREFFSRTGESILSHRLGDIYLSRFLLRYPCTGQETGLAVHFFQPMTSSWLCFSPHLVRHAEQAEYWNEEQNIEDEVSVPVEGQESSKVFISAADKQLAFERASDFSAIDVSLRNAKLSQMLALVRHFMEGWLVCRHQSTVDQASFNSQVLRAVQSAFQKQISAFPKIIARRAKSKLCKVCCEIAKELANHFGVRVISHDEQEFPLPIAARDYHEEDGEEVFREPSSSVLSKWEASAAVQAIIKESIPEKTCDQSVSEMTFSEVLRLLGELSVSESELLAYFEIPCELTNADGEARSILRRFSSQDFTTTESLQLRDLYRLLEVIGFDLDKLISRLRPESNETNGCSNDGNQSEGNSARFGNFRVLKEIGRGMASVVYLAEHLFTATRVALKFPVELDEIDFLRELHRGDREGLGTLELPKLLASGRESGKYYLASECLGPDLDLVFQCIKDRSVTLKWYAVRTIGRLLLRRLEVIHKCGFVHGDVATHNVLITRRDGFEVPYFIDFGCAQRFPGHGPVTVAKGGSMEFSSIYSAAGHERRPEDDLEALGWVMVHGIFGDLPWFDCLEDWYKQKKRSASKAKDVSVRVGKAKATLLDEGWYSLGSKWSALGAMPSELDQYLRACRVAVEPPQRPDYSALARLLGGKDGLTFQAAEQADRVDYSVQVTRLLNQADPLLVLMLKYAEVGACAEFNAGEAVHVWSVNRNSWVLDGMVQEVAADDLIVQGGQLPGVAQIFASMNLQEKEFMVPRGSLKVKYNHGTSEKWILPWEQKQILRRPSGKPI